MQRRLWTWFGLIALLAALPFAVRTPGPQYVEVVVDERPVTVEAPATVERALAASEVTPVDGVLLSAGTATVLDPHWDPARLVVDGVEVEPGDVMFPGGHLSVVDGTDEVEPTEEVEEVVPFEIPDVEYELWAPGSDGLDDVVRGTVSGEIVSRTAVVAMRPAQRVEDDVVVLTFDDGPNPDFTPQILATLALFDLRAVFCVTGAQATKHPELVQAIHDAGHVLCNHSENHPDLTTLGVAEIEEQVAGPSAVIEGIVGVAPAFFRAPYGAVNDEVISIVHRNGMRILGWAVDSDDWGGGSAQAIIDRVVGTAHPGAIVLLHDGGGNRTQTVAALAGIVFGLAAEGYRPVLPLR